LSARSEVLVTVPSPPGVPAVTRIAFASGIYGKSQIMTVLPDGTGRTLLTAGWDPAWSPDGSKIAFVSDREGDQGLYVMNPDGGAITRVSPRPASDAGPTWSPDGTALAFSSNRAGNRGEIYRINVDGSRLTRLTFSDAYEGSPAWSPDGAKIAFVSDREGTVRIYLMDPDGRNATRVTAGPNDTGPAWSPDGRQLAYRAAEGLRTIPAGGGTPNSVGQLDGGTPVWSPEGTHLAFTFGGIHTARTNGTNLTRVTYEAGAAGGASWASR